MLPGLSHAPASICVPPPPDKSRALWCRLWISVVPPELPFGFWYQMVSRRQTFLWPGLASASPFVPDRRRDTIAGPIGRLREFRNRVGHRHRI